MGITTDIKNKKGKLDGLISKSIGIAIYMFAVLMDTGKSVKYSTPNFKSTIHKFWQQSSRELGAGSLKIKGYELNFKDITPSEIAELSSDSVDLIQSAVLLELLKEQKNKEVDIKDEDSLEIAGVLGKNISKKVSNQNITKDDEQELSMAVAKSMKDSKRVFSFKGFRYNLDLLGVEPYAVISKVYNNISEDPEKLGKVISDINKVLGIK